MLFNLHFRAWFSVIWCVRVALKTKSCREETSHPDRNKWWWYCQKEKIEMNKNLIKQIHVISILTITSINRLHVLFVYFKIIIDDSMLVKRFILIRNATESFHFYVKNSYLYHLGLIKSQSSTSSAMISINWTWTWILYTMYSYFVWLSL